MNDQESRRYNKSLLHLESCISGETLKLAVIGKRGNVLVLNEAWKAAPAMWAAWFASEAAIV